jgi:hypothetical protein
MASLPPQLHLVPPETALFRFQPRKRFPCSHTGSPLFPSESDHFSSISHNSVQIWYSPLSDQICHMGFIQSATCFCWFLAWLTLLP